MHINRLSYVFALVKSNKKQGSAFNYEQYAHCVTLDML